MEERIPHEQSNTITQKQMDAHEKYMMRAMEKVENERKAIEYYAPRYIRHVSGEDVITDDVKLKKIEYILFNLFGTFIETLFKTYGHLLIRAYNFKHTEYNLKSNCDRLWYNNIKRLFEDAIIEHCRLEVNLEAGRYHKYTEVTGHINELINLIPRISDNYNEEYKK